MRSTSILISVITVVKNGAASITETINSVRNQELIPVEHIIIDGASTDETRKIVIQNQHKRLRVISEKDAGIYDAMNKGIGLAQGDWLIFLGADDKFADIRVLEDVFHQMDVSPYRAICGRSTYLGGKKCIARLNWRTLIFNTGQHQAIFYHRSLFNEFIYRTDIPIIADYELNFLTYHRKLPTLAVERAISICGNSGVSQSANPFTAQVNAFRIRTRYLNSVFNAALLTIGFSNILASHLRNSIKNNQIN